MSTTTDPKTATTTSSSENNGAAEVDYDRSMIIGDKKYRVLGTRPIRHDGVDKVTGRALYGSDIRLAGMAYAAVIRSPHAHARILSVETRAAEKATGVLAVITNADFSEDDETRLVNMGEGPIPLSYARGNILAKDKVLYKGHAVAAVAALTASDAAEAAKKIVVKYEPLPSVETAPEAMADGAPVLHADMFTVEGGERAKTASNVIEHIRWEKGSIAAGFAQADVIIEREFDTATVHQGYIEPQNATALWNSDGRLQVWTATQGSFNVRQLTANVLALPVSQVKVTPMEIGGGFGGKIPIYLEPVTALLSKKCGRPVQAVMSRQEVFEGTGPTPGSHVRVKLGATKDGRIVAGEATLAYEAGAYPPAWVRPGAMCVFSCYDIENAVVDGYDVLVNKPATAPYRAPGSPNAAFATESVVNELAEKLGIDSLDLRLKNAVKEGDRRVDGPKYPRIGLIETLEAMKSHPHYSAPIEGENVGRGIAVGFWFNAGLESSVSISVNADGTVNLVEGSTDIGGTRTSLSMQAAEVLGIDAEDVQPTIVDTDSVGFTSTTGGSRVTYATGIASHDAAQDIVRQMKERAALLWGVQADAVAFAEGVFSSGSESIGFKALAAKLSDTGGPVVGRATVNPKGAGGSFAGDIVDLYVDPETGKTDVLRFTVFQDAGKAIHPSYVEGQMQGGSAQGIGWALNEEYFMDSEGVMRNSSLLDYRMPTSLDLPMIDTCILEVPNPGHPFGVRGVGEASIVPPPAALADAIHHAAGVRLRRLPMNPVRIMEARWANESS